MRQKTTPQIEALKAKIALQALPGQATGPKLANAIGFTPTRSAAGRSSFRIKRRRPLKAADRGHHG
jgi:hypothetical protein